MKIKRPTISDKPLKLKSVSTELKRPPIPEAKGEARPSTLLNPAATQLIAVKGIQILSTKDTDLNGNGIVGSNDPEDQYILLENVSGGPLTIPQGASLGFGHRAITFDQEVVLEPEQELRVATRSTAGKQSEAAEAAARKLFPESEFYFADQLSEPGFGLDLVKNEEIALKIGGKTVSVLSFTNEDTPGLLTPAPDKNPSQASLSEGV